MSKKLNYDSINELHEKYKKEKKKLLNNLSPNAPFVHSNSDYEDDDGIYKNPFCAPTEIIDCYEKKVDGKSKPNSYPAISSHWIEEWNFGKYNECSFKHELIKLSKGFEWLLKLKFYKFWSQILYEPETFEAVKSFVLHNKIYYSKKDEQNYKECEDIYNKIFSQVFFIFQRLIKTNYSKSQYFHPLFHRYYVQKHGLFTKDIVLGICRLYGDAYPIPTKILITVMFRIDNHLYFIGSKELVKETELEIYNLHLVEMDKWFQFVNDLKSYDTETKQQLFQVTLGLVNLFKECIQEKRLLMKMYPPCIKLFRIQNIEKVFLQLFNEDIPYIIDLLKVFQDEDSIKYKLIFAKICIIHQEVLKIIRYLVLDVLHHMTDKNKSTKKELHKYYLELLSEIFNGELFVKYYVAAFNVKEDNKKLLQLYPESDQTNLKKFYEKYSNILQKNQKVFEIVKTWTLTIENLYDDTLEKTVSKEQEKRHPYSQIQAVIKKMQTCDMSEMFSDEDDEVPSSSKEKETDEYRAAVEESLQKTPAELDPSIREAVIDSYITEIKSILPHLGEGFITECLKQYNYNIQEVIGAILEEKLPPHLQTIDFSMPLIPEDPLDKLAAEKGHNRRTVYEGDEFDQMTKETFDPKRVFRKKNKYDYNDIKTMLDDKSHVKNLADKYEIYSCDLYDDDYDEMTGDYQVVLNNDLTADEAENRLNPNKKNNANQNGNDVSSEESEDEEGAAAWPQKSRNAFCEDPAVLRERAEANRAMKQRRGGGGPKPQRDVVGNPKGQGQDKSTVQNRERKNVNKANRGNHSRRAGAQWKRNRGMIPS